MTTFDKREKAFEDKFAYDANLKFLAQSRRNKRLGVWAADRLGLKGDAAEAYARAIRQAELSPAGDQAVLSKLRADFAAKSISIGDGEIHTTMAEYYAQACREVSSGF